MRDIAGIIVPCLLSLADRNDPICVGSPKVAKASTIRVMVASIFAGVIVLTFANGTTTLDMSTAQLQTQCFLCECK